MAYNIIAIVLSVAALLTSAYLDIVSRPVTITIDARVVQVWEAIAPYVEREREINPTTGRYLMRPLEEFAADVRRMSPDAINKMIEQHRHSWATPI